MVLALPRDVIQPLVVYAKLQPSSRFLRERHRCPSRGLLYRIFIPYNCASIIQSIGVGPFVSSTTTINRLTFSRLSANIPRYCSRACFSSMLFFFSPTSSSLYSYACRTTNMRPNLITAE